jgi:hypothetical protein
LAYCARWHILQIPTFSSSRRNDALALADSDDRGQGRREFSLAAWSGAHL